MISVSYLFEDLSAALTNGLLMAGIGGGGGALYNKIKYGKALGDPYRGGVNVPATAGLSGGLTFLANLPGSSSALKALKKEEKKEKKLRKRVNNYDINN